MREVIARYLAAHRALLERDADTARRELAIAQRLEPQNAVGHILMGRALAALGEREEAAAHDRAALERDANFIAVHLHLAEILSSQGRYPEALTHIKDAYRPVHTYHAPYTGAATPVRVLQFSSAVAYGLTNTDRIFDPAIFDATTIAVQYWERGRPLPPHDIIVNSIADPEACGGALDAVEWLTAGEPAPIFNPVEAIRQTGRISTPGRLGAIEDVVAPSVRLAARSALAASVERYPVLLRSPGFHNGKHFAFVAAASDLESAVASLPGNDLLIIEYAQTRSPDGRFRKYRVMFVDRVLYPAHLAISDHWNVHYFSARSGADERREERLFLESMEEALGLRAMAALQRIADRLDLDYAGIDFGIDADGRVVVFEANAAMTVFLPEPNPADEYRRAAALRIDDAARRAIVDRIAKHRACSPSHSS